MKAADVKKLSPTDRLIYWVREREKVRLGKESGKPAPWTDDVIFQSFRFCCPRRMDDKVSRWLFDTWYKPYKDHPNTLAAVALGRFFNLPHALKDVTGYVFGEKTPAWEAIKKELRVQKANGRTVFNGAYIVRADNKGRPDKIADVIDGYVRPLYDAYKAHPAEYVYGGSMQLTHQAIQTRHGYGSFMAGQVVADLRHAVTGDWSDRNDWAPVGPGSARGLARLLHSREDRDNVAREYTSSSARTYGCWLSDFRDYVLGDIKTKLPKTLRDRLEAHDLQNCLCEFDKYERVLWGEGRPKQTYPGGV